MNKLLTVLFGIGLILFGLLALAGDLVFSALGFHLGWWEIWRIWPLLVVGLGLFFTVGGLMGIRQPAFGMFFIPGLPILTTGCILFFASVFNGWGIWALAWPLEILSLAAGFLFAALFGRVAWLGIPAILIGLNGLVLAFCNLTGWWSAWSVLWAMEPLAVGLCLLLIAAKTRSTAVTIVGLAFCSFAALAFVGMSSLLAFGGLFFRLSGPALLILLGLVVLALGFVRPTRQIAPTSSQNNG